MRQPYKETFFRMIKVKTCVQLKQGQGDRLMVYKTWPSFQHISI